MEHIDYTANVTALEAVLPEWLDHLEITANLGATWIPVDVYEAFFAAVHPQAEPSVFHEPHTNSWRIETYGSRNDYTAIRLGSTGKNVWDLFTDLLHQRQTTVYVEVDGKRIRDESATLAARERQQELADAFTEWVWSDTERCDRLERIYNERFNSHVVPTFDGSHLHLPGLSAAITPHQYQRDAVWRTLTSENGVLLRHAVGAGKTLAAAMSVMELRRIGAIRKGMIVVPNHMLDEWARQIQQAYPQAKILLATREMTSKPERQRFASMCALGDWDMVVISESGFGKVGLRPATLAAHLADTLTDLDVAIAAATEHGQKWTVKRVAKAKERLIARRDALMSADTKDVGVTFEQLGVDFVVVDELHRFKNLEIVSCIDQVGSTGSKRAEDLMAKLNWLRRQHPDRAVILGLTATPISNGVAEMHTITRYVAPEILERAGVESFDAWAAVFAQTVNMFELAPEGNGYRTVARFARFHNVPEMSNMYLRFADVVTDDDLAHQRPDAQRRLHKIEPGAAMRAAMQTVVERAKAVRERRVAKEVDNMLSVATTGRQIAVDPRLAGMLCDADNKLTYIADNVAGIYHDTADNDYGTDVLGGTQVVFCDLGTPARDGWNVYNELLELLNARGVKRNHVAFVQDAKTDAAKGKLFAEMRSGRVRILLGSTETCGVGMNVQTRVTDLHHINPPWKPAEIEQRDGRGWRQGNLNKTLNIHTYVVETSFDAYSWTILTRKAGFLAQLANGHTESRSIDVLDVDDRVMSFEEIKAIASGNPLVLRKAELDAEHYRLTRLRAQHRSTAARQKRAASDLEHTANLATREASLIRDVLLAVDDDQRGWLRGDNPITVDQAGELIAGCVTNDSRITVRHRGIWIEVNGRQVTLRPNERAWNGGLVRKMSGHARHCKSAVSQIDSLIDGLNDSRKLAEQRADRCRNESFEAATAAEQAWPHQDRLDELATLIVEVNAELAGLEDAEHSTEPAVAI